MSAQITYMYWYLIEVYWYEKFVGSFYTTSYIKKDILIEIRNKFGKDNFTRYTIE
jgi:hypothetical protein